MCGGVTDRLHEWERLLLGQRLQLDELAVAKDHRALGDLIEDRPQRVWPGDPIGGVDSGAVEDPNRADLVEPGSKVAGVDVGDPGQEPIPSTALSPASVNRSPSSSWRRVVWNSPPRSR